MEQVSKIFMTANVELRILDGKGKSIFATSHFKKGDTIFEEDPLVSCQFAWNKAYKYLACDYCMRPLETVEENISRLSGNKCFEIPFLEFNTTDKSEIKKCVGCEELYCSENCLTKAYKQYHQFLCYRENEDEPLYQLAEQWKQIHYPPETMNIMMLARIIATIEMAEEKDTIYNTFMKFCHASISDDEAIAHKLLGEQFQYDINELWQHFSTAMQSRCQRNEFTDKLLSREGFMQMLSLLGRNGQGIGTSILAEWANKVMDLNVSDEDRATLDDAVDRIYSKINEYVGSFIDNEGTGLYAIQSCINHSCAANATITFPYNNNKLVLIAKRNIMPGDEICINYLDKCSRKRSCHSRRKILRDNYLFICMCSKCSVDCLNEPDVTSEEESEEDEEMM